MLVLSTVNDNIQVQLAGAVATNQLPCMVSWRDITTTTYAPGRNLLLTNNATQVNLVPAPAAATQRVADFINIFNNDTAAATVTILFDLSGTDTILWRGVLQVGEHVEYSEGAGFRSFTSTGAIKGVGATGAAGANGGGTVLGSGTSILDFGAASSHAMLVVIGQPLILAGSLVYCWVKPEATVDHSADEHIVEPIRCFASSIVAGVGFTLHALNTSELVSIVPAARLPRFLGTGQDSGPGQAARQSMNSGGKSPMLSGRFSIGWLYTQ